MSTDPGGVAILLAMWCVVGTGVGGAIATSDAYDRSPWTDANWAQRIVLAIAFGPLFVALCIANVLAKRFLYPPVVLGWRWLGKL